MSKQRTGNVETFTRADGSVYFRARIRLKDGSRERVKIPKAHDVDDAHREAWTKAKQIIEDRDGTLHRAKMKAAEASKPAPRGGLTLDAYRELLAQARIAEGKSSVSREQRVWSARVSPTLGKRPIATITRDQVEDFRDKLDDEVKKRIKHGGSQGLAGKSALTIWSLVRSAFKEAVNSRDRSMRVRGDDPTRDVKPPLTTASRKKTFFYPNEFSQLMACSDVPLEWREVYAVAAYLYLRPGELRALTWADVDTDAGIVHVTKAYDEEAKNDKAPKTDNGIRDVPIDSALMPLLERMRKGKPAEALVVPVLGTLSSESKRAPLFRSHLRAAKLARPGLLKNTPTTLMVNFRSLRDSGITWLALAGVELARMQRRAGHDDVKTTLGYVKMAEDLTGKIGSPFAPLPFAPAAGGIGPSMGQAAAAVTATSGNPLEEKLRLLDSNALERPPGSASGRKIPAAVSAPGSETAGDGPVAQAMAQSEPAGTVGSAIEISDGTGRGYGPTKPQREVQDFSDPSLAQSGAAKSRDDAAGPRDQNPQGCGIPSRTFVEVLREKLDAAIVAERWDAVAAIRNRIVEIEREHVVDLETERGRRKR